MARIVVLSDIHLSPTHGFFWQNWCIARGFANMLDPEAVIVNGDLCINGPDSDAEMAFAASALRDLGKTVFALPGNHDVGDEPPGQDADQIINTVRLARWSRFLGPDRWSFGAGAWQLIGANAQLFGSGLPQEAEQRDWLNEQISAAGSKPIALFLHKPLFLDSPDENALSPLCTPPAARRPLLELIKGSGTRLVVGGHLHQHREMAVRFSQRYAGASVRGRHQQAWRRQDRELRCSSAAVVLRWRSRRSACASLRCSLSRGQAR